MDSGTKATTGQLRVVASKDRLQAWIELPGLASLRLSPPGEEEIVAALTENKIELTHAVRERVRQCVQITAGASQVDTEEQRPEIPERLLIAEGHAPVDAKDGEFAWDKAFDARAQEWQGDAPVNYYTLNSILTIEAGTTIGRIIPPTEGELGTDVFGREVSPRRAKGLPLKLGNGLRAAEGDPLQVVTEVSGRLMQEGNAIRMNEVLEIPGDVDFTSGNIDACIDVHVHGDVKPNFSAKTTKSLTIDRAVEAAELNAEGDIQVRGGLFGHESGHLIKAGGSITAAICDAANVESAADINISKEIVNSNMRAGGILRIERGSIIGGEVYARNGVKLRHAGSGVGVPTRIAVGTDGAVLYRALQIERQVKKRREQAEQIRARVAPLLANIKRLTSAQREQAAELISKRNEIELTVNDSVAERKQMLERAKPDRKPGVDVTGTLYPGVVLVFGLREATIKTPVRGHVRVEERRVKGATEIAIVNQLTASVMPLPSVAVDVERLKKVEQKPEGPDGAGQGQRNSGNA